MAKPKEDALDTRPETALATFDEKDTRGKESFDSSDVELPRLAIAQKTSGEIEKGHPKFVPGLEFGDLFNSITNESFGVGPVPFVVIRHVKNAVEFDKDLKVVDRNVPLDDPRCQFTETADGKTIKPRATVFQNYLILLTETLEPMVLRLKSTQLKAAKQFNSQLLALRGPIWSGVFSVSTAIQKFDSGSAGVYNIAQVGPTPADVAITAEQVYEQTESFGQTVVDRTIKDEQTEKPADDDSIPF